MSIVMQNAYARQIIRDSMDNLRRKMEAEWKSQERRHHSIPIGVWTVQKKVQMRNMVETAQEIRRRANGIKGALNLPYKNALYRAADAMDAAAVYVAEDIQAAHAKHDYRAQKKETENERQD